MAYLLFVLSLWASYSLRSRARFGVHSDFDFGFESGGTANITVYGSSTALVFALLNDREISRFEIYDIECDDFFNRTDLREWLTDPVGGAATLIAEIPERDVYTPSYLSCGPETYTFKVFYNFTNPNSMLDYRWQPALIFVPIFVGVSSLLVAYWLINWATHFTLEIKIHYLLTSVFVFSLACQSLWYGILRAMSLTGEMYDDASLAYSIVAYVYQAALFVTLLFGASGWYIARTDLPIKKLWLGLVGIVLYIVGNALLTYVSLSFAVFLVYVISVFGIGLYVMCVFLAIRSAANYILAHLFVIQARGIAPMTTPIYKKYEMVARFLRHVTVYCVLLLAVMIMGVWLAQFWWAMKLIDLVVDMYIQIVLVWLFSLRKERRSNYMPIEGDGEGDSSVFTLEDLQSGGLEEDGQPYEEGMALPPPPRIADAAQPGAGGPSGRPAVSP
jgi:hypothetical protein